jgi:hypothetical protein
VNLKIGRNDPCWCGSGKKFKKCHLGRELQESEDRWQSFERLQKSFRQKGCLAPPQMREACKGKIVSAHTVPRGAALSEIADSGHVMAYAGDPKSLTENSGRIRLKRIGVSFASTFFGFCAYHDQALFSSFETKPFLATKKQCLDITFRAVCRELYAKRASAVVPDIIRGADRGKDLRTQRAIQDFASLHGAGISAAISELEATYEKLADAITLAREDSIGVLIVRCETVLPVMFSAGWPPTHDLKGKEIQDLANLKVAAEGLWISTLVSDGNTYVCISWIRESHVCETYARQIAEFPDDKRIELIVQLAFRYFENVFVSPKWYRSLDEVARGKLNAWMNQGVLAFEQYPVFVFDEKANLGLPAASTAWFL